MIIVARVLNNSKSQFGYMYEIPPPLQIYYFYDVIYLQTKVIN